MRCKGAAKVLPPLWGCREALNCTAVSTHKDKRCMGGAGACPKNTHLLEETKHA